MNCEKLCEKINRMERSRGGLVRAVSVGNKAVFTVQAPDRRSAVRSIVGAAFAAGFVLSWDGGSVMDNGSGMFTASVVME